MYESPQEEMPLFARIAFTSTTLLAKSSSSSSDPAQHRIVRQGVTLSDMQNGPTVDLRRARANTFMNVSSQEEVLLFARKAFTSTAFMGSMSSSDPAQRQIVRQGVTFHPANPTHAPKLPRVLLQGKYLLLPTPAHTPTQTDPAPVTAAPGVVASDMQSGPTVPTMPSVDSMEQAQAAGERRGSLMPSNVPDGAPSQTGNTRCIQEGVANLAFDPAKQSSTVDSPDSVIEPHCTLPTSAPTSPTQARCSILLHHCRSALVVPRSLCTIRHALTHLDAQIAVQLDSDDESFKSQSSTFRRKHDERLSGRHSVLSQSVAMGDNSVISTSSLYANPAFTSRRSGSSVDCTSPRAWYSNPSETIKLDSLTLDPFHVSPQSSKRSSNAQSAGGSVVGSLNGTPAMRRRVLKTPEEWHSTSNDDHASHDESAKPASPPRTKPVRRVLAGSPVG